MDVVFIRGLQISTIIGAYDWERQVRQVLVVDVEMAADIRAAAEKDELAKALNYSTVAERITQVVQEGAFQLIETAAERVADTLLNEFGVAWLRLDVAKPRPFSGGHVVGVRIERGTRG